MYPKNYCSGDSHEYEGYECSTCSSAPDTAVNTKEAFVAAMLGVDTRQAEFDFNKDPSLTLLVKVDSWAERYYSEHMSEYVWEANCAAAYPDGVVRVPEKYFVSAKSDGTNYHIEMVRDEVYLKRTRQSYLRAAAAK